MVRSLTVSHNQHNGLQESITQRVILPNVRWQTYQDLLKDLEQSRSTRLAYDNGRLEIIMPSDLHEITKHLLERIVATLTEEFNLPIRGVGSVTLKREDLQQGVEPDAGFYIQNAARVRGKRVNLEADPPPDLVIEVDINSSSMGRLPIYQALGVNEVWRCTQKTLTIYSLQEGEYKTVSHSVIFPAVSSQNIKQWLDLAETEQDDNGMVRSLRQWVQTQK